MTDEATNPDTWAWRDLPVLRHAVRGVDDQPIIGIGAQEIEAATGLSHDDCTRAQKAIDAITGAGKKIGMAMAIAYATGQIPGH